MYAVTLGTRLHSLLSNFFLQIADHQKSSIWNRLHLDMSTPSRRATESQAGGGVPPAVDARKLRQLDKAITAITHPGSVKINVEGAFIVDEEANSKNDDVGEGIQYEHKDIRLPHHTAVVSHVAVDVRQSESHVELETDAALYRLADHWQSSFTFLASHDLESSAVASTSSNSSRNRSTCASTSSNS